jgi:magnesium transporter
MASHKHLSRSQRRRARKAPGTGPGAMIYEGSRPEHEIGLHVFNFTAARIDESSAADIHALEHYRRGDGVTWINVDGVHEPDLVNRIGEMFGLHPLTREDIVSTRQRPKMEEYPTYIYVVLQMLHYDRDSGEVDPEQMSLVIGDGFLLSFQEHAHDVFEPVRRRLREGHGPIRHSGADFLAYTLIDIVVDYYMDILEGFGERIEDLEDRVTVEPDPGLMQEIAHLRRRVVLLRRAVWPLRDVALQLERSNLPFMSPETDVFFRDVYDHAVRTVELIESAREILASLTDLHLSTLSFRMNEVMKMLAVIATFFLPLSFIAGLYGMNFDRSASAWNMPELGWSLGYPWALGLMATVATGMVVYFRRKRWI